MRFAMLSLAFLLPAVSMVLANGETAGPKQRRILYNLDGDSCMTLKAGRQGPGPVSSADLATLVEELTRPGSQVDTLLLCVNAQVMYYPSEAGTLRGSLATPEERAAWSSRERQRFENLKAFYAAGLDPYAVVFGEARRRGLETLLTFRMNDAHGNDFLKTEFWRDHPEYRLANGALDFAHGEVRDYVYRLIEEAVRRYDVDGLELDFQRFPTFFRDQVRPIGTQPINSLVKRVRKMLDTEGIRKGRRLVLGVRPPSEYEGPPTYERSLSRGCDPAEWARRGWIDFITVSDWLFNSPTLGITNWKRHIEGVPVYGAIQPEDKPSSQDRRCEFCIGASGYRNLAQERWKDGADGIYLFNFFTAREWEEPAEPPFEVLSAIGDPATVKLN